MNFASGMIRLLIDTSSNDFSGSDWTLMRSGPSYGAKYQPQTKTHSEHTCNVSSGAPGGTIWLITDDKELHVVVTNASVEMSKAVMIPAFWASAAEN